MALPYIVHPSPNYDARPDGVEVDMLVLHYTGMPSGEEALVRMCDPEAKVSAHYMVEEDGRVFQLVDEAERAWHAGVSCWQGQEGVNACSIGIEIVNPGHEFGYRPFPKAQMEAVIALCKDICSRHKVPPQRVVAHSDVAPERKEDPGELFDWKRLAEAGVGLWPGDSGHIVGEATEPTEDHAAISVKNLQSRLKKFGYPIEVTGYYDPLTRAVVTAFQRRFRPDYLNGVWDQDCATRLESLIGQSKI